MGKLLFWAVVIIGGLLLARILAHSKANRAAEQTPPPTRAFPKSQQGESMVQCEHCGIHLPRSEAVMIGGRTWCSQEHARLGVRH
ncbi:PP0621 family protein [Allopusillimonas ginsengisoli]|uniref:PP0621 family protein n=1 Tax=Allopusillimonas ginsengisoli TaxID=453575 RepID=UPI0010218611|nr:PP0621 family protein [Allopusillimonas ginsengisoli]TEA74142.1 hypothetical protein ERE07_18865 [Allopusillimonas ginsengisoli]